MSTKFSIFFYIFISVSLFLILALQYQLWLSDTGVLKYRSLKEAMLSQAQLVQNKSQTNEHLYSEVISLRKNNKVLENLARENMGLIKTGEIFYIVN